MSPNMTAVTFPVVIGLMMVPLVHAWRQQRQQRKAADWPSVEGRIEAVDVVLVGRVSEKATSMGGGDRLLLCSPEPEVWWTLHNAGFSH